MKKIVFLQKRVLHNLLYSAVKKDQIEKKNILVFFLLLIFVLNCVIVSYQRVMLQIHSFPFHQNLDNTTEGGVIDLIFFSVTVYYKGKIVKENFAVKSKGKIFNSEIPPKKGGICSVTL